MTKNKSCEDVGQEHSSGVSKMCSENRLMMCSSLGVSTMR